MPLEECPPFKHSKLCYPVSDCSTVEESIDTECVRLYVTSGKRTSKITPKYIYVLYIHSERVQPATQTLLTAYPIEHDGPVPTRWNFATINAKGSKLLNFCLVVSTTVHFRSNYNEMWMSCNNYGNIVASVRWPNFSRNDMWSYNCIFGFHPVMSTMSLKKGQKGNFDAYKRQISLPTNVVPTTAGQRNCTIPYFFPPTHDTLNKNLSLYSEY